MKILVTGGAGYIATHTEVSLIEAGYDVVSVDNFSKQQLRSRKNVEEITGKKIAFYEGDVCDKALMRKIFSEHDIYAVIHFAGLKAVGESVEIPLTYYKNNLFSAITLLEVMKEFNVKKFIFSSSATVYGVPKKVPLTEDMPVAAVNPYGSTKLMIENILKDLYASDNNWNIVLLRYFNPVGAHKSGLIGEDPKGIPNNLMPYIAQVAAGKLESLVVHGNDYPTPDGTGVRDYIHITDLAEGHLAALEHIDEFGVEAINLGTGTGYSVLEMLKAFEKASGKTIKYRIGPRRAGDVAVCYASPDKAKELLGWSAKRGLDEMCQDLWNFQKNKM